jgi:predicted ATPase
MIYLRHVTLPEDRLDCLPFTIPALKGLERLDFSAPVTLLAGDNGAGKSTLLEASFRSSGRKCATN